MEDLPASLSCSDCQRHFPSLPELARHRELLHPSPNRDSEEADCIPRPYRCQQCGRGYRHPGSLVNHRRTHETGLFSCTTCSKDFTNPMALKSHMRTHAPEGRRRRRPPRPKETIPDLQGEMVSTDSWGQGLNPGEGWENKTRHTQETSVYEPAPDPRAAPGTWVDPSARPREGGESQPDPEVGAEGWGATTNSVRAPPLPTPASSLLSNLEQYLAESVVNFTGGQEPTQSPPAEEERRYKCSQCGKTYKHAGSLTNHRQSHTLGIYPCAICFKEFSNLMALKNHSRLHAQYRPYHCPHCPRAFRLPRELLEHQQTHEGERQERLWEAKGMPTTNGHTDESSRDQLPHTQMVNGSGELSTSGELEDSGLEEYRPFRCGDCGRTYRHAGSLINHRKSHQTGVYPCSICSKQLFNAAALKNHVRAHHRPQQGAGEDGQPSVPPAETTPRKEEVVITTLDHRPYKCNECGRAYRHRGSLVNHRHSHRTGEYQCSLCPRKYPNLMALRNHVRVHCKAARRSAGRGAEVPPSHLNVKLPSDPVRAEAAPQTDQGHGCKPEEEGTIIPPAADGAAPQICSVCGMLFEDLESLEHHGRTHEAREGGKSGAETRMSPPRAFACRDCGKSYRHSGSLINHRQTHQTGDFRCGACAKHFHTMAAMKNHLRRHIRRRGRRHRRRAGSAGGGGGTKLSEGHWAQELVEDNKGPGFSQDPSGKRPSEAEGTLGSSGDCLQSELEGDKCGLKADEACFQGDKESRGNEEGLERKACFLDNLDVPGDEGGSGASFCHSLDGVDEDQKPATGQPTSSSHSAEAVSGWQAEASHTCSDCGHSFPHATGLLSHRPCHPPGIYQCSLCPKEFDSLPALRSHFQNHGPGEAASAQPFLCCLCGMIFPGRAGYRLHQRQAHSSSGATEGSEEEAEEEGAAETASPHSPPLQLSEAELLNQLQREVEALDGAGYGHICGCCGQTYDDLGSLERHHQSLDSGSGSTIDKAPSRLGESGDATEMGAHDVYEDTLASVSEEGADTKTGEGVSATVAGGLCMQGSESSLETQPRPFRCNQCGKTYRHGGSLVNHRKIHQTGDFVCPVCSRCYPNLAAYRNHLRNHPRCKGSEPQVGLIPDAGGSSEPQNVTEEGLGEAEVEKLQEELKVEPLEEVARVKEEAWEETTVKGEETEPRLETAEKGCQTEASSERPFSCEVCGRSYKHAGSLINHQQSHQTGHFGCQACSKGFSNLMSLKNHRRIHADPRRFRCGECGKAFRLRKQLASHQRVHVEWRGGGGTRKPTRDDRPFRCGQCGRTYRHAGSLLNHRRSHETGQYSCPACPKTYSNCMALRDHQRLHSETRRRRAGRSRRAAVRCALCGQGFPGRGSLERHLREHEKEAKQELAGGQRGPPGTEGSEGNLTDAQALGGSESEPLLEDGATEVGECSQSPLRAAGSEATGPLTWDEGKAHGWQVDRGPVSHDGGWAPRGVVLTKTEEEPGDSVPKSLCHLADSQCGPPILSQVDCWDNGDSSSQLQPESCPFSGSQDGETCQSGSLLNHHNTHKTDCHHCPLCSKEFLNPVATRSHSCNHTAAQTSASSDCGKALQFHPEVASHLWTHARGLSQAPPQTQESRGPRAGTLEDVVGLPGQGIAQVAPSEPPGSPREDAGRAGGEQGVKPLTAEDKERPFRCAQCGRSYRHAGSLLNHQKAHTTGLYPCSLCPKLLPNLLSLKNHGRTHTDPKRHRCGICGKAFRTAARLEGHGRVHAPREGPFSCPRCPRHFRRRVSFLQHQQQHQEEWTMASSGAPAAPAAGSGDLSSPPAPIPTTPLLDPSPQWPADLSFSL
ncbi:zinc finger protein 646 [Choloepus didactylus]|uniref:zinc finger protein 646 n=1 Tax=Choloepus didactylus TaxID=27675 RepID=UPI00189FA86B|nr:zinc finger protein 646 [Choloepus didactylus]XP_037669554.1 zinc finger protein 646 [Choloepus didactylus]XP_037669555.1 zinc finger protein 646 [Choloepus didactylus]XP_037669556.1 zinc finger protein 646 [Choloepus didactylus]XP_037669557.1 zinc finger protein 646 [Choloepus didactylus]